jgi:hypothetical protein
VSVPGRVPRSAAGELRVVGAGLGRTGTSSLKLALEQLLGGPCYHMLEVGQRPADVAVWDRAIDSEPVDWAALLAEFRATVDWPAAAFWRELSAANPGALVLLSSRDSAQTWWRSMEGTIAVALSQPLAEDDEDNARRRTMIRRMMAERFTPDWRDPGEAMAAYERHLEDVRRGVAPERLVDWRVGDGWEPICAALGLAVPDEQFPHENRTTDFRLRMGLEDA